MSFWDDYGSQIVGSGMGLLSGLFGSHSAKKANQKSFEYSIMLQNHQNQWMENMSNSAHQREVADLRAAGLNPILSTGGSGASTPSAGSASFNAIDEGNTGFANAMQMAQLRNLQKETKIKEAQQINDNKRLENETDLNGFYKHLTDAQTYAAKQQAELYKSQKERQDIENLFLPETIKNVIETNSTNAKANYMNAVTNDRTSGTTSPYGLIQHYVDLLGNTNTGKAARRILKGIDNNVGKFIKK